MRRIVREGVKTPVLMLSATPVNTAWPICATRSPFATEGDDDALAEHGVASIDATTRLAQKQFNRWLDLERGRAHPTEAHRDAGVRLLHAPGPAHHRASRRISRSTTERGETGRFPERLKPINVKPDVDLVGEFPLVQEINAEIRRLNLAAYAPLRYVLPHSARRMTRNTALDSGAAKDFFDNWTAKRASFSSCASMR